MWTDPEEVPGCGRQAGRTEENSVMAVRRGHLLLLLFLRDNAVGRVAARLPRF